MIDPLISRPGISRRQFLKRAAATSFMAGGGAFGYAWRIEPHWIQVVRRELPIANLPGDLVGRTLVQISDLHIGPIVDETYIVGAMQRVSDLKADIIVITGDFITYAGEQSIVDAARVLRHLQPARLATIGILGNHDYGHGFAQPEIADQLRAAMTPLGMTMLRNSMTHVSGLQIVGIDDLWSPRFAPQLIMPHVDPNIAALVLCHNPDAMDLPVWSNYKGWILSGHTHGGQCSAPLLGPPLLPVRNKRYTSGEFDLHDGRRLYINRGLGYMYRVRFNVRPEITVFTLRRAVHS